MHWKKLFQHLFFWPSTHMSTILNFERGHYLCAAAAHSLGLQPGRFFCSFTSRRLNWPLRRQRDASLISGFHGDGGGDGGNGAVVRSFVRFPSASPPPPDIPLNRRYKPRDIVKPGIQRWAKRWTCFAKQPPGRPRKISGNLGPAF